MDPIELRQAADYVDEVTQLFYPPEGEQAGFMPPWVNFSCFAFRPGEVCLLAGVNGHGKSEVAGHITLSALSQGERACIASMEFRPARWAFDVVGTAKADRIIEVFIYARRRYGISLFVIDNLAKCGFAEDDYNAQKAFVDKLTDFAREHASHVLLVVHMRKRDDERKISGKLDIKGTGALTDMADSVLIAWRNKGKENEIRKAQQRGEEIPDDLLSKPDAVIACEKQRNGEEEPVVRLWFDRRSHQFLDGRNSHAKHYVEFAGAPAEAQGGTV